MYWVTGGGWVECLCWEECWSWKFHVCPSYMQGEHSSHSWAIAPQARLICHKVSLQRSAVFLHFPPPSQLRPLRGSIKQVRHVGVEGGCASPSLLNRWVSTVTGRLELKIFSQQHLKYRPLQSVCQLVHLLRHTYLTALAERGACCCCLFEAW